jgi:hypothetical protein
MCFGLLNGVPYFFTQANIFYSLNNYMDANQAVTRPGDVFTHSTGLVKQQLIRTKAFVLPPNKRAQR